MLEFDKDFLSPTRLAEVKLNWDLCSTGAFWDSGVGAGLGNFWKRWVRVRRDSAIKKLLKIFLFIFSIYFYYKIFLKNTFLCLDSQKKERRMQVSAFPAIFKADFGRFRPVSAGGRYDPILAESAQFGANWSQFGMNRAASVQIEPNRRESEKKKKKKKRRRRPTRGQPRR